MRLDLPWDGDHLKHKEGCPIRLYGVDVYYDFNWFRRFDHHMGQFPKGQRAAEHLTAHCPKGKKPALVLTKRDDVEQGFFETPKHLVLVLQIDAYSNAPTDPALSYLAALAGKGITRIGRLSDFADVDPDELRDFLARWTAGREDRLAELRGIPGVMKAADHEVSVSEAIAALAALDELPADAVSAMASLFGPEIDVDARLQLLRSITDDPTGRWVTGEVLVERTSQRIEDARAALVEYEGLLQHGAGETELQEFIEHHPWLLGLEYVRARPRKDVPRATADFILERYDGFHDLLELKTPQDPVIRAPAVVDGVPPSPSKYSLSRDLAQALAQVHVYRDILNTDAGALSRYGLVRTRDPRVVIVIGRGLPPHTEEVLRELNKTLHRMEVLPYDVLAARAKVVLDNVERYVAVFERDAEAA